jgi:hypothetical protein
MLAFIIRPFGEKNGIDFERVEKELIDPALRELDIGGRTTGEIARAGNIREDMFELLLTADLVIADISIHNANVFYELGIRHAFCDKYTYLIRSRAHDVPFDLRTDRYLEYERDAPAAALPQLLRGLRETLDSGRQDSPVFLLLPRLEPQDRSRLLVVPSEFREEVRRAEADGHIGDLGLLAEEARRFRWAIEGLRTVGVVQFDYGAFDAARSTWEQVRSYDDNDLEANRRLATIYQKLGDLTRSDQAVSRVLENRAIRGAEHAEFQSLLASNAKARWMQEWAEREGDERREAALRSPWLEVAHRAYSDGFAADRNHYYSGLNALALLTVQIELGRSLRHVWSESFETEEGAKRHLDELAAEREKLIAAVDLALQGAKKRLEFEQRQDRWLDISLADFAYLVSSRSSRVASLYRSALKDAASFYLMAARRQLAIYQALEVLTDNGGAALAVIDERLQGTESSASQTPGRVLLFTGHRIDAPDRKSPRFPPAAEEKARAMIRQAVEKERQSAEGEFIGYAGGASGGDVLFHEVCAELGIKTQMLLAAPREAYVRASVQDSGAEWVTRFDKLHQTLPTRVLADSLELPRWMRSLENYSVWQRTNDWMLHNALVHGASRMTLIALWNGEGGNGPGGTEHMVEQARQRGARTVVLDTRELLQL